LTANKKELIFSVSIQDCEIQTFPCGKNGGQNGNRNQTGVRLIHNPSGARGESREFKSQLQNKRAAFERMAMTEKFQWWCKSQAQKFMGKKSIDQTVDELMSSEHIKVEFLSEEGWVNE
jgi:protein subunit release factor A